MARDTAPITIHGNTVEYGIAYQMELADGTIFTARWDGLTSGPNSLRFYQADGDGSRTISTENTKWFDTLNNVLAMDRLSKATGISFHDVIGK